MFGQVINKVGKIRIFWPWIESTFHRPWGHWSHRFLSITPVKASRLQYVVWKFLLSLLKRESALSALLVYFLKENRLTHRKKVNDSVIVEEKLDEKKSLWIVNSANADLLVARDRGGLGVSDKLVDILSDWLYIIESVVDDEILSVTFAMIFSDAGRKRWGI